MIMSGVVAHDSRVTLYLSQDYGTGEFTISLEQDYEEPSVRVYSPHSGNMIDRLPRWLMIG